MGELPERYPDPLQIGSLTLADGLGVSYAFRAYPVRALPVAAAAVYAFARFEGTEPVPVLIAHAPALGDGTAGPAGPAGLDAAVALGAIHLLVHEPDADDPIPVEEVARRLIARHRPPLNRTGAAAATRPPATLATPATASLQQAAQEPAEPPLPPRPR